MKRLKGIVPVLVTPVNSNGSLDIEGLRNLIEYYNNEKVTGLWVLGTGGEDMGLSFDQRLEVTKTVVQHADPEIKLVVGCSFYSVQESFNFIRETSNMKFDAYHAMPYHPKVSNSLIIEWYKKLAANSSKPFWAYTSGNWAQNITPEMIKQIKNIDAFEGVKYSTSNSVDLQSVSYLNSDNFQVISAVIKTYFYALCLGLEATTSVEATCFLTDIRKIETAYNNGNILAARDLQMQLNARLAYPSTASKDNFLRVAELKYMISKSIDIEFSMTKYYRDLHDNEKAELDQYLNSL